MRFAGAVEKQGKILSGKTQRGQSGAGVFLSLAFACVAGGGKGDGISFAIWRSAGKRGCGVGINGSGRGIYGGGWGLSVDHRGKAVGGWGTVQRTGAGQ